MTNKTFETFVVGWCNKAACEAVMEVADGTVDVPVFIYGEPNLGKTHLLEAVANELRWRDPAMSVILIKGDQLVLEAIQATRIGTIDEYWERFREAAVVLVDDVQFLGRMVTIQEYFCEILRKKRAILVADCLPENLPGVGEVLKNYFKTCFRVEVQPPDFDTRVAIVESIAARKNLQLPKEVITYVAENVTDGRLICRVVNKLLACLDLLGADMDENLPN